MNTSKMRHHFTRKFCLDFKTANLTKTVVAKKARELSNTPTLGRSFDPFNPECKQWSCIINRELYHWHYIYLDKQNVIQSVALSKYDIKEVNGGPIDKLLFGMRLFGTMAREFIKGLLIGS